MLPRSSYSPLLEEKGGERGGATSDIDEPVLQRQAGSSDQGQ